jgi:glycosyltransferase involved in cell wall biosynthesis
MHSRSMTKIFSLNLAVNLQTKNASRFVRLLTTKRVLCRKNALRHPEEREQNQHRRGKAVAIWHGLKLAKARAAVLANCGNPALTLRMIGKSQEPFTAVHCCKHFRGDGMSLFQHDKLAAADPGLSRLRIAQLAPLYESVPPKLYGGTERIVAYLVEELVRRGHEVTLYASGDSTAKARLAPGVPQSLRLAGLDHLGPSVHLPMLSEVYDNARDFDIIHSHVDCLSFPLARLVDVPTVSTMHGRLDRNELLPIYRSYSDLPLVSISNDQRRPLPESNWIATVYHGLPRDLLKFSAKCDRYLAFIGRVAPEKRLDLAIEIARRSGLPLKIAAKIDQTDRQYFESVIKPMLSTPGIEFIGEISESQKEQFLGGALALLFPVDWPEPFGLVMIEALACGTPVIARPCGSVPEVLRHGVSGFIGSSLRDLVAAVRKVDEISRQSCRHEFESRFTVEGMAANYERVYYQLAASDSMNGQSRDRTNLRTLLEIGEESRQSEALSPA